MTILRTRWLGICALLVVVPIGCGSTSAPVTAVDASSSDTSIDAGALDSGAHDASDASDATDAHDANDTGIPGDSAIDTNPDATPDATTDGVTSTDSIADMGAPETPLMSCMGVPYPITLGGSLAYVQVGIGASTGNYLFDTATTFSSIDPTAFTPSPPTSTNCTTTPPLGNDCDYASFDFLGTSTSATLEVESFGTFGGVLEAGILGTDFTSLGIYTIDWTGAQAHVATQSSFCARADLLAAGWHSITTAGYFSSNLGSLAALSTVQAGASSSYTVPNVPTIPTQISGVKALTQIDTGFYDSAVHHSVNVNVAFYTALVAADASALVRDAANDLSLSTCISGLSEPVQAYKLASGRSFQLVADDGSIARAFTDAEIFVKQTPSGAKTCGGIGTWTVPAAQIGGSLAVSIGSLTFDPYASVVWAPPG